MWKGGQPGGPAPDRFSEEQLHVYVRQLLSGRVVVGDYHERSYVPQLGCYRDVVELSVKEKDVRSTMEDVQARLQQRYGSTSVWTSISSAGPDKLRLHVTLKDVAFGRYWFLLKTVKFTETEVVLRLKCLRPFSEAEGPGSEGDEGPGREATWDGLLGDWGQALSQGAKSALAVNNMRQLAVFLVVMVVGLVTGAFHVVRHLGDFTIRLLREFSGLVRALTPLMLGIVDFFAKCVGGLYLLIGMLFRGRSPAPGYPPPQAFGRMHAIKYESSREDRW